MRKNGAGAAELEILEGPGCRHRDYVLMPYKPLPNPGPRLHSVSALRLALSAAGQLKAAWPLVSALRSALGEDETVWGVTHSAEGFSCELYFYNRWMNPPGNPKSAENIRKILKPFVSIAGKVPASLPYFMCSLDLTPRGLKAGRLPEFKVYFGSNSEGPSGFSYRAERDRLVMENNYQFYRMPAGLRAVKDRLRFSVRGGRGASLRGRLLPGYLAKCGTICYAVKPLCDALYFSRVNTAAAVRFCGEYPAAPFRDIFAGRERGFSHLLWDVSFNFAVRGGRPFISKTGLYGVL